MQWFTKILFSLLLKATLWLFKLRYGAIPGSNDVEGWRLYIQKIANGNDVSAFVLITPTKIDDVLLLALKSVCGVPVLFQTAWTLAFNKQDVIPQPLPNEEPRWTLIQRIFRRFSVLKTQLPESTAKEVEAVSVLLQTLIPENCKQDTP